MGEACNSYGRSEIAYNIFVRKREGKRPRGQARQRWESNIGTDVR